MQTSSMSPKSGEPISANYTSSSRGFFDSTDPYHMVWHINGGMIYIKYIIWFLIAPIHSIWFGLSMGGMIYI